MANDTSQIAGPGSARPSAGAGWPGYRPRYPGVSGAFRGNEDVTPATRSPFCDLRCVICHAGRSHIYDSVRRVRIFGTGDVLDGEDILPGFHMAVDELFEEIASPDE
jgi:hypothetical protein